MHGGYIYDKKLKCDFSVNINPYTCNEIIKDGVISADELKHYPDPFQGEFRRNIAELERIDKDMIWGGSGASELFMAIVRAVNPKKALVTIPSFSGYLYSLGVLQDCRILEYRLSEENGFRLTVAFLEELQSASPDDLPDLIFLANPGNPTGQNIESGLLYSILKFCDGKGIRVIVDECFLRLSEDGKSCKPYVYDFDGLYVVDAFTKLFAVPGARIGYVVSSEKNIEAVKRQLPEWNMSVLAQKLGCRCAQVCAGDFTEKSVTMICIERNFLGEGLQKLGFKVYKSDANFILFYADSTAGDLYNKLLDRGILIRDCSDYKGLEKGFYRVAVKKREENELLLKLLEMETENV